MVPSFLVLLLLAAPGPVELRRHAIDAFPAGYQVAAADLNGDGKPDVIALSTEADRVDWYENPSWTRRPIARSARNIDLAVWKPVPGGRPGIALASGFYFSESTRGGEIRWLEGDPGSGEPWKSYPIATDPVVHRLRWGDLDGDGRPELVHAPIFGPGSQDVRDPRPSHLWAFRPPREPSKDSWETWKIDESLTVLHGIHACDLDGDGRDEVLAASFEGIHRLDLEGEGAGARWKKVQISRGAEPADQKPGSPRGSSEVAPGTRGSGRPFIAAIEPWHGSRVVLYTPGKDGEPWRRAVLDEGLSEGHALVVADLDGDGSGEIIAGWRGAEGGLALYDPRDSSLESWRRTQADRGIAIEGAVAADLNGDGRADIAAIAGRSNLLVWYENLGKR